MEGKRNLLAIGIIDNDVIVLRIDIYIYVQVCYVTLLLNSQVLLSALSDLKAFERRLTEVICSLQPATLRWRSKDIILFYVYCGFYLIHFYVLART